jgi:hypothetical protein
MGVIWLSGAATISFRHPLFVPTARSRSMAPYRIEAGPISINPAPPAMFSGVLRGQTLTLSVTSSDPSPPTCILRAATDKRFRQVRGSMRLKLAPMRQASLRTYVVLYVVEREFDVGVVATRIVPSCLAA